MQYDADFTSEMISRSVCLFREYHGLYEDDYEGTFYWDPVTGMYGSDMWTTAGAGGGCHKETDYAYTSRQVYRGEIPQEYKERILKDLREEIKLKKACFVKTFEMSMAPYYNKYSYQKEAFQKCVSEFEENFEQVVDKIDSIPFLLYYIPKCTSGSYKNDKDSLRFAVEKESLVTKVRNSCKTSMVEKRERKISTEGMDRFEGKVISVKSEYSTYGLRSDWKTIYKVGVSQGEGKKTVWFTAPKGYDPERGQTVEVYSKNITEYERSIQVRRPVVNVLN